MKDEEEATMADWTLKRWEWVFQPAGPGPAAMALRGSQKSKLPNTGRPKGDLRKWQLELDRRIRR